MKKKKKTIEQKADLALELENRAKKHILDTNQKPIGSLFSKDFLNEGVAYELNKIIGTENKLNRDDLI